MEDCVFCKVATGELPSTKAFEDDQVMVIKDINPQAPVHWLVITKKHMSEFLDTTPELVHHMMDVVRQIIKEQKIAGYRIVNNGKGAAFIDHMHIHVLGSVDKFRKL